jgi:hypothetical protein
MEILGQPKQFAGGGIVNALMATPVGQAAIQKYQKGGDIKFGDYVFDYKLTDDDPLDILRGLTYDDGRKARFYSSEAHMKDPSKPVVNWGRKEDIVEQITEDLTPQRRRKKKVEEQGGDDAGGSPPDPNQGFVGPGPSAAVDVQSKVDTFSGIPSDPLGLSSLMTPSLLANLAFGFTPLGLPNTISNILGGPTVGGLLESFLQSQTAVGKALAAINDATMGGSALGDNPEDLYQRGMVTNLAGDPLGLNNPFAAAQELGLGDTEPSVDVQTQVDTFSDINDQTMDSGDDDDDGQSDGGMGNMGGEMDGGGWT